MQAKNKYKNKNVPGKILSPQGDYKHPHKWEKNCTLNFNLGLDRNGTAT